MTETASRTKLVIRRRIAAPAETLFDAWLDAASLAEWMRPGDVQRADVTLDPRVGGKFRIVMHGKEDSYDHTGEYRVIERPRRLAFTWVSAGTQQRASLVTVEFVAGKTATEVVLTHERLPDELAVDRHTSGWTRILEFFDRHCAQHSAFQ